MKKCLKDYVGRQNILACRSRGQRHQPGLKEILEKIKKNERRTAIGWYHDLLNLMYSKGGVALTDWDGRPAISLNVCDAFAILKPGDYWTRVDGPDVRETGKLCFTDDWVKKFESYGKPIAEIVDWYDSISGQAKF